MIASSALSTAIFSPSFLASAVQGFNQLNNELGATVNRLASGNRIIQISDDVAAATVAAGLQSQAAGYNQATSNAAAGSSLLQVAAGGLQQISDIITTMQSLASESANTSTLNTQRAFLQAQFAQSFTDIDAITNNTSFNGVYPLKGYTANFLLGPASTDTISISIGSATSSALFGNSLPDISSAANATSAETSVTNANNKLQGIIDYVNGAQAGLDIATGALTQSGGGNSSAAGNLTDTNIIDSLRLQAIDMLKINTSIAVLSQATYLAPRLLQLLTPVTLTH